MTDTVESRPLERASYRLTDRITADTGTVFLTGVQALARLPIEQLRADRVHGLSTAAFLSGYPGSPLGGFDREAIAAANAAPGLPVVVRPAVNEELAATAVMGSQLAATSGRARYDGVLGIWYGKTPGLDRASDALRHAVFAGADPGGGAVAFVGDDPTAKSSTLPSSSDRTMEALALPFLAPGRVADVLVLGRHAIAMSRLSGAWTALRIVTPVADGTGTVALDTHGFEPIVPDLAVDGSPVRLGPSGKLLAPTSLELERELVEVRLELARRYGVDNRLNRITVPAPDAWIGLVAAGHTYYELREALARLGMADDDAIAGRGVRLLQVQQPFPFDGDVVREFATGLDEIVVVEDKRALLEPLIRDALYGRSSMPTVLGKRDEVGAALFPAHGSLDADRILPPLRARLARRLGDDRIAPLPAAPRPRIPLVVDRTPHFCSGCPHNTSTKVPDGALVGGGIGCSSLVALMPEERIGELVGLTAMGAEGANWIGMAPFVETKHLVQYLGDGTYAHSGHLAIRATIAAGVDITFKILYNGAVSMTGGQHPEGVLPVPELVRSLLLEGVARVIVTTEDTDRYRDVTLPERAEVWDRHRIVEAQELLAGVAGTTVLIHDQACAAETRRARKRGRLPNPKLRVLIDERVCEGCGDCGAASNCLSVQPVETPYGRKTRIDQASCNLDLSCLEGDCPAFITVEITGDTTVVGIVAAEVLPEPERPPLDSCTVRMSGIGGTGVVTVSQILGTAALLDGLHAVGLDQTGLSQKAGPVVSDLRLSTAEPDGSNRAAAGTVDVELAFDLVVAAMPAHLAGARAGHTVVVGSTAVVPTAAQVVEPSLAGSTEADLRERIDSVSHAAANRYLPAAELAAALAGDPATANVLVLGAALQLGVLPVRAASVERAIELNGVAVERNLAAFRWGRQWVLDPAAVQRRAGIDAVEPEPLGALVARLSADLTDYQSRRYGQRFERLVAEVEARESAISPERLLTETVARHAHKLMAYKDEYEVARLLLLPSSNAAVEAIGGPGARARWHLHPPALRSVGLERKLRLGRSARPLLVALRAGRRLRGTALDPFGRSTLRHLERELVEEYESAIRRVLDHLNPATLPLAVRLAALPDRVRGYEELKRERAQAVRTELARLEREIVDPVH